jgi:chemotaxis protein MotB
MNGPEGASQHELVIVRRRGAGDEAGGKGGVWKIAYADFMTAMMAFFLVMWLINAANEETRAQVASYFNPVKLTDSVTSEKGLSEPKNKHNKERKDDKPAEAAPEEAKRESGKSAGDSKERKFSEDELFKDPYVVLAQLAGQAAAGSPAGKAKSGTAADKTGHSGLQGGEAFRDPFDPLTWKNLPEPQAPAKPKPSETRDDKAMPASPANTPPLAAPNKAEPQAAKREAAPKPGERDGTQAETLPVKPAEAPPQASPEKPKPAAIDQAEAAKVKAEIMRELDEAQSAAAPAIDIVNTKEGVLISLTDTLDFGMFAIASAEPRSELVVTMEKIAKVLRGKAGRIVIRGHTDGRPYKSETYDNWRLSTARAHMAYYMLVRAGVDEGKVERIEGYADKHLKVPDNPLAAENRRIEIMLRAASE